MKLTKLRNLVGFHILMLNFIYPNAFASCYPNWCHYSFNLDRAGFYIATIKLPKGQPEGLWSLSVDKSEGFNDNGFHIGAVLKEKGSAPGFMAFNLSKAQSVDLTVSEYSGLVKQLTVQILKQDESGQRTLVYGPELTTPDHILTTPILMAGFYVVEITNQTDSERGRFGLSLAAESVIGCVHGGGWLDQTGVGFAAFPIDKPQEVNFKLQFGDNFGNLGANKPYLSLHYQIDGSDKLWPLMTRISVNANGTPANRTSYSPSISADGRYIAFLVSHLMTDNTQEEGIFIHDRQTQKTYELPLEKANKTSYYYDELTINSDGHSISYQTHSRQKNFYENVTEKLVYNIDTGRIKRVSEKEGEAALIAKGRMSRNERYVVSPALVYDASTQHLIPDLLIYDYQTNEASLVFSQQDDPNTIIVSNSNLSGDGRYIAFATTASLVSDDTNGQSDIMVRDRKTGEITRVSVNSQGEQTTSYFDRLHPIDICPSIYSSITLPEDTQNNQAVRAGYTNMCTVVHFPGYSSSPSMSSDGRYVAFLSDAPNLVVGDERGPEIYVHDRKTGETIQALSGDSNGPIFMDADGHYVAILENEQTVLAYVREIAQTFEVPVNHELQTPNYEQLQISAHGRYIIFTNQDEHQDGLQSLFIYDRQTDKTASIATGYRFSELHQSIDEAYITFVVEEQYQGENKQQSYSLFLYDFQKAETYLVSKDDHSFSSVQMSANGRFLIFMKEAPNFDFTRYHYPIWSYDHNLQEIQLIALGYEPSLSTNGRYLVFSSEVDNLVPDDTNEVADIFVVELMQ